jgi:hypothetical protein
MGGAAIYFNLAVGAQKGTVGSGHDAIHGRQAARTDRGKFVNAT